MRPRKHRSSLPPCVYHRHGAFWYVKRGKWKNIGCTLDEALAEHARLVTEPKGGLDKWVDEALEAHAKEAKISPATARLYKTAGEKLKHDFQEFSPEQVRQKHIFQWRRALADTPNMANRCLTVARIVFTYLAQEQIVDSNPAMGVKPYNEAKRERLIAPDEFQAIYGSAVPRLQCMMDLMFLTGQRLMDVVTIHESQIGDEGVYFRQAKTGARLLVRWTPELRATVERARALNKVRSLTLFRGRRGTPPKYKSVYAQWREACRLAGILDAQARDLRAMSATEARAQQKDPTALLGHATAATTRRYLRDKLVPVVDGPSIGEMDEAKKTTN